MAVEAKIVVTGDDALIRKLEALSTKKAKKVVRQAMRAGGKVVLAAAKSRAPRATGTLRKGLKVRAAKRSRASFGVIVRTPDRPALAKRNPKLATARGYYPAVMEFGSKHVSGRPFLAPAIDANRSQILGLVRRMLAQGIAREAAAS